jgi:hypothetical protein
MQGNLQQLWTQTNSSKLQLKFAANLLSRLGIHLQQVEAGGFIHNTCELEVKLG